MHAEVMPYEVEVGAGWVSHSETYEQETTVDVYRCSACKTLFVVDFEIPASWIVEADGKQT
jgi:hypothetical protein